MSGISLASYRTLVLLALLASSNAHQQIFLNIQVTEEQPIHSPVANLRKEIDFGNLTSVQLSNISFVFLANHTTQKKLFSIEAATGVIRTATVVDRDVLCPKQETCTVYLDVAIQPQKHFRVIRITIDILDINDNAPKFPKSRLVYDLPESITTGFLFPIQKAEDVDSPKNGVATYHLITTSIAFEVNVTQSSDGILEPKLILKSPLDREKQAFSQLRIVAYDGGDPQKSGSVVIDINVLDVNDNIPRFSQETYEIDLEENSQSSKSLLKVSATDVDEKKNAEITYGFSDKTSRIFSSHFRIDPSSGVIFTLVAVDYEEHHKVTLEVTARDGGEESIPVHAKVLVHIRDVNDNAPEFRIEQVTKHHPTNNMSLHIVEHSPPDTFVAHLSVVDRDSKQNSDVECFLNSQHFRLVDLLEGEYKILSAIELNRETSERHHLQVSCNDLGTLSLTSSALYDVIVEDINDHPPKFTRPVYNFSINENNMAGAVLGRVEAVDADAGINSEIIYSIAADGDDFVKIDRSSGIIQATMMYDFETSDGFSFHVMATDGGVPQKSSTCLVNIDIRNTNDESPRFERRIYSFHFEENQPPWSEVGRVKATDKDMTPLHKYIYRLDVTPFSHLFDVDPVNGTIFAKETIDREKTETFHLRVYVQGEILTQWDVTNVTVYATDVNDNAPYIHYPSEGNNTIYITNTAVVGQTVLKVNATDADIDDNGRLVYDMSDKSDIFAIHPVSGVISVTSPLNEVDIGTELPILVTVRDQGRPLKFTLQVVHVVVRKSTNADLASLQSLKTGQDASVLGSGWINEAYNIELTIVISIMTLIIAVSLIVAILCCRRRNVNRAEAEEAADKNVTKQLQLNLLNTAAA